MFLRFVPERCDPQMRASAAELWVLSRTPLECPPIATGGGGPSPPSSSSALQHSLPTLTRIWKSYFENSKSFSMLPRLDVIYTLLSSPTNPPTPTTTTSSLPPNPQPCEPLASSYPTLIPHWQPPNHLFHKI